MVFNDDSRLDADRSLDDAGDVCLEEGRPFWTARVHEHESSTRSTSGHGERKPLGEGGHRLEIAQNQSTDIVF